MNTDEHRFAVFQPRRSTVFILIIICSTLLVYLNSLRGAFQFDDLRTIRFNFSLRDVADWRYIAQAERFRPLLNATFALNYKIGQLEPFSYHLVNLLIHIANLLLMYSLINKTFVTPASGRPLSSSLAREIQTSFVAALLMGLHPLNTEAVTYISSRSILLCSAFYLLGLLFFDSYVRRPRLMTAILFFISYAAGCLTKEECALLPIAALLYNALFFGADSVKKHRMIHAISILLLLAGGVLRLLQVMNAGPLPYSVSTYFATQSKVLWYYIRLSIYPVRLNVDPDIAAITPASFAFWIFLFLHAAAIALLWRLRKKHPFLTFWGLWFWLNLLLSSSVFPLNDFMAEHRAYLSLIGYCACLSFCMVQLWAPIASSRFVVPVVLGVVLIFYGISTYERNRIWKNELTLWLDTVEKSPAKTRPHLNLGAAYTQRGNYDLAIEQYQRAVAINPQTSQAYSGIGICYLDGGDLPHAREYFERALAIDPNLTDANVGLGMTFYRMKNYEEALKYLVPQYNKRRESIPVTGMIANSYLKMNRFNEAIPFLEQFLAMKPSPTIYFDLLRSYIYAGQYDRARQFYAQNETKFASKGKRWEDLYTELEKAGH